MKKKDVDEEEAEKKEEQYVIQQEGRKEGVGSGAGRGEREDGPEERRGGGKIEGVEKDKIKVRSDKKERRIARRYRSGSLAPTRDANSCGTQTKMESKEKEEGG